jgi:hypothetical protein
MPRESCENKASQAVAAASGTVAASGEGTLGGTLKEMASSATVYSLYAPRPFFPPSRLYQLWLPKSMPRKYWPYRPKSIQQHGLPGSTLKSPLPRLRRCRQSHNLARSSVYASHKHGHRHTHSPRTTPAPHAFASSDCTEPFHQQRFCATWPGQ